VLVAIWRVRRSALGSTPRSADPTPDIGLLKMAMLTGGSQLAITAAAAKLHGDGVLAEGPDPRTHVVAGTLEQGADRLEREVVDIVHAKPHITTASLRRQLVDSDPIRWMASELQEVGLLLDERTQRRLRRLWCWSALAAALGVARIASDPHGALVAYVAALVLAAVGTSVWLVCQRAAVTARGAQMVRARRAQHDDIRRVPRAAEGALATALFGGGALWLADPALASTLDVPREQASRWIPDNSRCSAGGGCAAGVGCGAGGGGGHGGGGCGGGGCGSG
jgi:uncharacterized protein (TIGR04222 family)